MAEILGLGTTHAPTLWRIPEEMTLSLRRTLGGKNLAPHMREPANWPEGMRAEWSNDQGAAAGREYNRRVFAATRELRARLDAFKPDLVVRLNSEAVRALGRTDLKEKAMKLGIEVGGSASSEVTAMMTSETARMRPLIQRSGIKVHCGRCR